MILFILDNLLTNSAQDFRRCQTLIQRIGITQAHSFPPSSHARHEAQAAKNVQRGLAAKVQDLSASFRKKQRVYMESKLLILFCGRLVIDYPTHFFGRSCFKELQGHAIKNQDLLIASGTVSLKGSEGMSAVDEDVEAAVRFVCLAPLHLLTNSI
jgi:syntaxin 16